MGELFQKETYNQKDSMIILKFAIVGGCVQIFFKERHIIRETQWLLQFASVVGCLKYFKKRPIVRKTE